MCGRFTLDESPDDLTLHFELERCPLLPARFNISPGNEIPAIGKSPVKSHPSLSFFRWGLVPSWAKDASFGQRLVNARSETVREKASFREAFREKRCLIPASGFYEWKSEAGGKQPHYIHLRGLGGTGPAPRVLAFAGLWESWRGNADGPLHSCTILTKDAEAELGDIHHRMPIVIAREDYEEWLAPCELSSEAYAGILDRARRGEEFEAYAVGREVSKSSSEGPSLIARLDPS